MFTASSSGDAALTTASSSGDDALSKVVLHDRHGEPLDFGEDPGTTDKLLKVVEHAVPTHPSEG